MADHLRKSHGELTGEQGYYDYERVAGRREDGLRLVRWGSLARIHTKM